MVWFTYFIFLNQWYLGMCNWLQPLNDDKSKSLSKIHTKMLKDTILKYTNYLLHLKIYPTKYGVFMNWFLCKKYTVYLVFLSLYQKRINDKMTVNHKTYRDSHSLTVQLKCYSSLTFFLKMKQSDNCFIQEVLKTKISDPWSSVVTVLPCYSFFFFLIHGKLYWEYLKNYKYFSHIMTDAKLRSNLVIWIILF